jgi:SUN domain-containing protein 1/2
VQTFSEAECTGQHDFAAVKNGARVLLASKTFGERSSWSLWSSAPEKQPALALSAGLEQGQCWPMAGTGGRLEVELANAVAVSGVTLMHIHPRLAPKGDVSSAPKDFKVVGYPAAGSPVDLVAAAFDRDAGCMTFPVAATGPKLRRIAIEVTSNHGREELTCLYRFMVHGSV